MPPAHTAPIARLTTYDRQTGDLNVIIETPAGSRNKFKYDYATGLFLLNTVLPDGAVFPYDFGFIPATCGQDGDPLDVLVLMDQPAFTGCLVRARLVGVIEAKQTQDGQTERNDRLVAVASESRDHKDMRTLRQLDSNLLNEIQYFFVSYDRIKGKKFKLLGCRGPRRATRLVQAGQTRRRKTRS